MITREQAVVAYSTVAAVFDPEGMECAITAVARSFGAVVVEYNDGRRDVYRFDQLTPSRELLKVMEN